MYLHQLCCENALARQSTSTNLLSVRFLICYSWARYHGSALASWWATVSSTVTFLSQLNLCTCCLAIVSPSCGVLYYKLVVLMLSQSCPFVNCSWRQWSAVLHFCSPVSIETGKSMSISIVTDFPSMASSLLAVCSFEAVFNLWILKTGAFLYLPLSYC